MSLAAVSCVGIYSSALFFLNQIPCLSWKNEPQVLWTCSSSFILAVTSVQFKIGASWLNYFLSQPPRKLASRACFSAAICARGPKVVRYCLASSFPCDCCARGGCCSLQHACSTVNVRRNDGLGLIIQNQTSIAYLVS